MEKEKFFKRPLVVSVLAILCCALWGSAVSFIKLGYEFFNISSDDIYSQIIFAGLRFTLAGAFTIIALSIIRRKPQFPKRSSSLSILKLSLIQTVLQYFFFYVGLAHTSGVKGSIVNGTNTLLAILVATLVFRQEKLTGIKLLGCVIGLSGVILANIGASDGKIGLDFSILGEGFVFLSALSYAFSSCLIKRYSKDEDPIILSGYQFLVGGLTLIAIGIIFGGKIEKVSLNGILVLVFLAFVSAAAYSVWGILLKHNPVSRVTIYGFANPIISVLLSAFLLGEISQAINLNNVFALLLVSLSIFIVNKFANKSAK